MFKNIANTFASDQTLYTCTTNKIDNLEGQPTPISTWVDYEHLPPVPSRVVNNESKGQGIKKTIKKKTKRVRTAFTTDQLGALEKLFSKTKYIDVESRKELADRLNIGEKCIKIWFQNRRMKEKRDSESSSDSSIGESFAAAGPPVNNLQNLEIKTDQVEGAANTYSQFMSYTDSEATQYQLPTYQYEDYVQYQSVPNMFCYDTYMNHTHESMYYPSVECDQQTNEYAHAQCGNQNTWTYANLDTGYYSYY